MLCISLILLRECPSLLLLQCLGFGFQFLRTHFIAPFYPHFVGYFELLLCLSVHFPFVLQLRTFLQDHLADVGRTAADLVEPLPCLVQGVRVVVCVSHTLIVNTRSALATSCRATFSTSSSLMRAMARTTSATKLGSLRLPRYGTGVTYGASVSESSMSKGAFFTTSL